ncbi:MAG: hypothetical protein ACE5HJ_04085 [Thermoplasmata archaeon]
MAVSIALGLIAGFVAVLIMTLLMAPMMKKGPGVSQFMAARLSKGQPTDKGSMMGGMLLHLAYGTGMGGVYAIGSSALSLVIISHIVNGLLFGVLLFIIAVLVVTPLSKAPMKEMPKSMMGAFLALHLVYGLVLGAVIVWLSGATAF